MHAVAAVSPGPLEEPGVMIDIQLPSPKPGPHDLLVEVHAVSVNPVDTKVRAGLRPGPPGRILGYDAAGIVRGAGSKVLGFPMGSRVWYAGDVTRPGTNAEMHVVDHRIVGRMPLSLTFAQAAALPLTALTAWETLNDHFRVIPDASGTLLIVGGAGGVGSIAIQLAKHLTELTVLATAGRPESTEWVLRMGADAVVDRALLVEETLRLAPGGVDFLLTAFTAGRIEDYAAIVRPFGHITAIDGRETNFAPLFTKSIAWHWEYMFARAMHQTPDMRVQGAFLNDLARMVDAGMIVSTATTVLTDFTAAGLIEAHRMVESGTVIGKVVVSRT